MQAQLKTRFKNHGGFIFHGFPRRMLPAQHLDCFGIYSQDVSGDLAVRP